MTPAFSTGPGGLDERQALYALPPYCQRGYAWRGQGEYGKAVADFEQALRLKPDFAHALAGLAWVWAACPDGSFRDGGRAVAAATRACELSGWNRVEYREALAAAFAEAGQFGEAVEQQRQAVASPDFGGLPPKAAEAARRRLRLYERGQPYRDGPVADLSSTISVRP